MFPKKTKTQHTFTNAMLYGTVLSLKLLERFIKADIHTACDENIPDNPTLYVVY